MTAEQTTSGDQEYNSMQEILQKLGDRIRNERQRKGFSQEAFAEECGLHRTAMGLLERGKSIPRLDTLLIVSQHLSMPLSKLLQGFSHDIRKPDC
jgi:transcriptional regulator with XRE-family HTH domain